MTLVWLFAPLLAAAPNEQLAVAEDLVAQVRYADAEKALALARAQPGNPRATLLRILELQGVVAATLGQAPKARASFQQLLSLDPERKLTEGLPPRVRTPFYEAKGMVSEAAPMQFSGSAQSKSEGLQLTAKLSADPMLLAKKVRFHFREPGQTWAVTDASLARGSATFLPGAGRFEWWVELLGEHEASLLLAGSEATPFTDGTAPAAAADPSGDAPVVAAPGAVGKKGAGVNPLVWVCVAGAGATAIGGTVAGVLSRGALASVEGAAKDGNGVVNGITQRQAATLREQAKTEAIAANVLFGAAGVLAATGVAVWLFSDSSSVALVPGPGGVAIAGALPW